MKVLTKYVTYRGVKLELPQTYIKLKHIESLASISKAPEISIKTFDNTKPKHAKALSPHFSEFGSESIVSHVRSVRKTGSNGFHIRTLEFQ